MRASQYSFGLIDSILTIRLASMPPPEQTGRLDRRKAVRGGSDEAAWLLPQQRVLPGQDRAEPEGARRRAFAAPSAQGRAMRALLPCHQPAGAGAGAGSR